MKYWPTFLLLALAACGDNQPPTHPQAQLPVRPDTGAASGAVRPRQDSGGAVVDSAQRRAATGVAYAAISCPSFHFSSAQQQADTLVRYFARKPAADDRFFCAFPNSFAEMQRLFGHDDEQGGAPLYSYPNGRDIIRYFARLNGIPKDRYYRKFINICVDGRWEADNISDAFGFAERLATDTGPACRALGQRTDREIISVLYFIFDGPHPKNESNERLYQELRPIVAGQSERLGRLLTTAYHRALAADDGHGH